MGGGYLPHCFGSPLWADPYNARADDETVSPFLTRTPWELSARIAETATQLKPRAHAHAHALAHALARANQY